MNDFYRPNRSRLQRPARNAAVWLGQAVLEQVQALIVEVLEIARRGVVAGLVGAVALGTGGAAVVGTVAAVQTVQAPPEERKPWFETLTDTTSDILDNIRGIRQDVSAIRDEVQP